MKKIVSIAILLCIFVVSLVSCVETDGTSSKDTSSSEPSSEPSSSESSTTPVEENTPEASDHTGLISSIKSDCKYRSMRLSGNDRGNSISYDIEHYESDGTVYYSVLSEELNKDWLVKYSKNDPDGSLRVYYNGKWTKCISAVTTESYIEKENHERLLSFVTSAENATDNTLKVGDITYKSKRSEISKDLFVDFLCRDGKWDAAAITSTGGEFVIFDNFFFSSSPRENGRIAPTVIAPDDNDLICSFVLSESMSPTLHIDDLCFFDPTPDSIKVGDIVLAESSEYNSNIIHRISNITDEGYTLRGDMNNVDDREIFKRENILGVFVSKRAQAGANAS